VRQYTVGYPSERQLGFFLLFGNATTISH